MKIENELGEMLEDTPGAEATGDQAERTYTADDIARLKGALDKERELKRNLEKEVKSLKNQPRTLEERLAVLEKRNQELELAAAKDAAIREAAASVEAGYQLDREMLDEWLSTAALNLDNVHDVVTRAVARCKKPAVNHGNEQNKQAPAGTAGPQKIKTLEEVLG